MSSLNNVDMYEFSSDEGEKIYNDLTFINPTQDMVMTIENVILQHNELSTNNEKIDEYLKKYLKNVFR